MEDSQGTPSSGGLNKEEFRTESIAALRARAQAHAAMLFGTSGGGDLDRLRPDSPSVEVMDSSSCADSDADDEVYKGGDLSD
jgi:hypothetical protein